ncbi:hypothetical protein LDENG_00250250 [Lucifuga dentata]|nr:hypothetical protein LDENG_00250250 [Lucifuga dentata]
MKQKKSSAPPFPLTVSCVCKLPGIRCFSPETATSTCLLSLLSFRPPPASLCPPIHSQYLNLKGFPD